MIIIIAVIVGVLISRYYKPHSKSQKIWSSILIPLVSGIVINLFAAACKNPEYGFAFNYGATFPPIAISELVLFITLLIALKVNKKEDIIEKSPVMKLHYGRGENRVEFEMELTDDEANRMAEMRKQDPEKWRDNDLKLLRCVRKSIENEKNIVDGLKEQETKDEEKVEDFVDNEELAQSNIDKDYSNDETHETSMNSTCKVVSATDDTVNNTKMGKGLRILIAVIVCIIMFLLFGLIAASMGWKHGGGALVMIVFISLVAFVWRSIVVKKEDSNEDSYEVHLHTGAGENRINFVVLMTQDEILQMSKVRGQDPEKWKDNEYELVRVVKPDFKIDELENIKNSQSAKSLVQTVKLQQEGIELSMSLPSDVIEQMELIRQQEPQKWEDKEVELVREAKKTLKSYDKEPKNVEKEYFVNGEEVSEPVITRVEDDVTNEDNGIQKDDTLFATTKEEPSENLFGNKLESEYRRESKTESHWIRQNGTEMCLNIDEITYKRMVEIQHSNPKRWVNKELDLYYEARNEKERTKLLWKNDKKTWLTVLGVIIGVFVLYGIVATIVDYNIATCDETVMNKIYTDVKQNGLVECNYPVFRFRMIANSLYRKKIYRLWPYYYTDSRYYIYTKKTCDYNTFYSSLKIDNRLENPFVLFW